MTRRDADIILLVGLPCSGRTTYAANYVSRGYMRLGRDRRDGAMADLLTRADSLIAQGVRHVVLDDLFPTVASRLPFLQMARERSIPVQCHWLDTSMDDAQVNACLRMIALTGTLPSPEEIATSRLHEMVPISDLYQYKREFERPTEDDGFETVVPVPFQRWAWGAEHVQGALILDADDTIRATPDSCKTKWPTDPGHVEILANRRERLAEYAAAGYRILGVSNQSGVARGLPPREVADECYRRTNELLGIDVEWRYCPHTKPAEGYTCYCRKPLPGLGAEFILKHSLDPSRCLYIGDRPEDKAFARKLGFSFSFPEDFFD